MYVYLASDPISGTALLNPLDFLSDRRVFVIHAESLYIIPELKLMR
jgi:hypothetical protein